MLLGESMIAVRAPHRVAILVALVVAMPLSAAAQSRDLSTYVLFALSQMRTKGVRIASSGGDVGVNDPNGILSASSHNEIRGPNSEVVADTVLMSPQAECAHLFANSVPHEMPSCGPATGMTMPIIANPTQACGYPDPFPADCDRANLVNVGAGTSTTLAPGVYGDVIVFNSSTLTLSGNGTYVFCSLRAGRDADIRVQAPATIEVVDGTVNLSNGVFLGPDASVPSPIAADAIKFFASGPSIHFSGGSDVHTSLCAPNAMLRLTHDASLEGRFVADTIRTERISAGLPSTTTLVSSTTTTTLLDCSRLCGNGRIDPQCNEECDGSDFGDATCPGSSTGAFLECTSDCTLDTSNCPCGNGVIEPFEECDPVAQPTGCRVGQTCSPAVGHAGCRCVGTPAEICGNCIDDDGNGLTDFEDPACCPQATSFTMTIKRGRLRPLGAHSRLKLRSLLASLGLEGVDPRQQDVFLQIRQSGHTDLLCLKVPAEKFKKKRRSFRFRDKKGTVPSAEGLQRMRIIVKKNKRVLLRAFGKRVNMTTPGAGDLQVTIGFHDPTSDAKNMCSSQTQAFRTGHKGKLRAP
jgi:hypothetical protein